METTQWSNDECHWNVVDLANEEFLSDIWEIVEISRRL